jgi:hypothetical protein
MYHCGSMCCGVHGRIADGVRAARTVGVHRRLFHGRPRTGRAGGVFRHEVNGGAGRASPCGRPAARAPSRDKGQPGRDRRPALPATGHPGPAAGLSGSRRYPGPSACQTSQRTADGGQTPSGTAITERD